jgi:SAM-dependent methyltransferase
MATLKVSYNRAVEERDQKQITQWKIELRDKFFSLLENEGKANLLEIGAGTGDDSLFFQDHGMEVTCTDLSPENVRRCLSKGLNAIELDFKNLGFPSSSFDAIYAMNCLLHAPQKDFEVILESIYDLLKPTGLFFLGQYGGREFEGSYPEDHYNPKRFFSFLTDAQIQRLAGAKFKIEHF